MGEIFKTFLAKFSKVFGLTFVTAFCMIQLASVTGEDARWVLGAMLATVVLVGVIVILAICLCNEEFYVLPTVIVIIVGITPFIKSYLAALGIAVLWLGYELFKEKWFRDVEWHMKRHIKERKKAREKHQYEMLKRQAFIEEYGEKNTEVYDEVIKSVDEMIRFNEELSVDADVWVKIKQFISDKPESASKMRELLNRNVILMLDVYHQLPKDETGSISEYADEETLTRCKKALYKVNKSTLKSFSDKKKLCNLDLNVCLDLVEKSLVDE